MYQIIREPVSSSNIVSIGYSKEAMILEVEYHHGVYQYMEVPESVYWDLMNVASKGTFMNQLIKPQFTCVQV